MSFDSLRKCMTVLFTHMRVISGVSWILSVHITDTRISTKTICHNILPFVHYSTQSLPTLTHFCH
jgi:hypothetical protein